MGGGGGVVGVLGPAESPPPGGQTRSQAEEAWGVPKGLAGGLPPSKPHCGVGQGSHKRNIITWIDRFVTQHVIVVGFFFFSQQFRRLAAL